MPPRGLDISLAELVSRPAPERRGFNPHKPVEEDRWWEAGLSRHAPKVDTEKRDVLGEIMRMKVKDGDIIIMRVPRNYSKMAIQHHIKSIRSALNERGINASVAVVLKEVDLLVMSNEGENILGVDMHIE